MYCTTEKYLLTHNLLDVSTREIPLNVVTNTDQNLQYWWQARAGCFERLRVTNRDTYFTVAGEKTLFYMLWWDVSSLHLYLQKRISTQNNSGCNLFKFPKRTMPFWANGTRSAILLHIRVIDSRHATMGVPLFINSTSVYKLFRHRPFSARSSWNYF